MTTEEIKRRAELYSALAKGKIIQVKNTDGKWADVKPQKLNYIPEELVFRIKPEPKCRPFRTQEECWEEMHKHPDFGWLKCKETGSLGHIGTLYTQDEALMVTWATNENTSFRASYVFNEYTFTDGALFGIKEE